MVEKHIWKLQHINGSLGRGCDLIARKRPRLQTRPETVVLSRCLSKQDQLMRRKARRARDGRLYTLRKCAGWLGSRLLAAHREVRKKASK